MTKVVCPLGGTGKSDDKGSLSPLFSTRVLGGTGRTNGVCDGQPVPGLQLSRLLPAGSVVQHSARIGT